MSIFYVVAALLILCGAIRLHNIRHPKVELEDVFGAPEFTAKLERYTVTVVGITLEEGQTSSSQYLSSYYLAKEAKRMFKLSKESDNENKENKF